MPILRTTFEAPKMGAHTDYYMVGGGGYGVSDFWGLPGPIWGPAQEKYMSVRARNMSADKNTATETTFPPPDGLEQRFLGLAHPPPPLFRPFSRIFCQDHEKPWKTMKNHKTRVFMVFPFFDVCRVFL